MHGFIFSEIQRYVEAKLDRDTWEAILQKADLGGKKYMHYLSYPDEEAVAIVSTASEMTNLPVPAILEDFGAFLGGHLFEIYRPLINPSWKTLDFLENVEQTIHDVVRGRNKHAKPPVLQAVRASDTELTVTYRSHRDLVALACGIIQGVAKHYGESVSINVEKSDSTSVPTYRVRVQLQAAA